MKTIVTVGNLIFQWNGLFYEMKVNDPARKLFLDMRHRQTMIQLNRHFIDIQ